VESGALEENLRQVVPVRWREKGRRPRVWAAPEPRKSGAWSGGGGVEGHAGSSSAREVRACGTPGWMRRVKWWERRVARLLRAANAMADGGGARWEGVSRGLALTPAARERQGRRWVGSIMGCVVVSMYGLDKD
jgi:hypothetical protein